MASSLSNSKKKKVPLIKTTFKLPADLPVWPPGDGFATGIIDLGGGLLVSQISSFNKVYTTYEGGPDNLGATFFEPTNLPEGFYMLGCYCQPNNKPLHGFVLVGKDKLSTTNEALKKPIDYQLICNINSTKTQDSKGYIWLPIAPDGYKVLGHVVTTSPKMPSFDKIRCVRSDLTDECVKYKSMQLWSTKNKSFNVYDVIPMKRGIEAKGVYVGTFLAQSGVTNSKTLPIVCLKNTNAIASLSSMPNLHQIETLINSYSPYMYLHPREKYLPCSVNWFFINGALLYEKRKGIIKEISIEPTGSNLPQGESNDVDVTYWIDLPLDDDTKREIIKKGDLQSSKAYIHVKPMLGGTFTDIVMWIFYPFNGGAKAKVACTNIPLRSKGEHVGDWEHVTLRVSNFSGELWKVYFSQHSKGQWVDASEIEFEQGNRVVAYSSLNGHALFPRSGLVMQGMRGFGIRNDAQKGEIVMDLAKGFEIVSAGYLGSEIIEPPWLNYKMNWGPKEGPKGPKQKDFWKGDER